VASKIKNIELLYSVFGENAKHILNKLDKEKINISQRSSNFVLKVSNLISNYVDFIHTGDFSSVNNKTINTIQQEYNEWFNYNKINYSNITNSNQGTILFDYRENDIGYYWVNLNTHYSVDMMFNMNNCGRVGVTQNLVLLREQKNTKENLMHVLIVISNDNFIVQIKGVENSKPNNFYEHIFDFLLKYEPINGFKGIFNPKNDFSLLDLKSEDVDELKKVKPHLFQKII
jgi:hypothetical protein